MQLTFSLVYKLKKNNDPGEGKVHPEMVLWWRDTKAGALVLYSNIG